MGREVAGLVEALTVAPDDTKGLILSDSQARRRGNARARDLRWLRQSLLGPEAVRVGWVKAHVGIYGNERADREAKAEAEKALILPRES